LCLCEIDRSLQNESDHSMVLSTDNKACPGVF
jgi:hypothetical protein